MFDFGTDLMTVTDEEFQIYFLSIAYLNQALVWIRYVLGSIYKFVLILQKKSQSEWKIFKKAAIHCTCNVCSGMKFIS